MSNGPMKILYLRARVGWARLAWLACRVRVLRAKLWLHVRMARVRLRCKWDLAMIGLETELRCLAVDAEHYARAFCRRMGGR